MAIDQIEYCGSCEHYAKCQARVGKGPCLHVDKAKEIEEAVNELDEELWAIAEDESNGVVTDPLAEEEVWVP